MFSDHSTPSIGGRAAGPSRPRVAVIGSGISGLAAAHTLKDLTDVTLFEAGDYFGGHTHTVDMTLPDATGRPVDFGVDTGFLVLNERTYPQLLALLSGLDVAVAPSDMSFSVQAPGAGPRGGPLEWSGSDLGTVFAQRANLGNPRFWRMLADILRFNRLATRLAERGEDLGEGSPLLQPLGDFLREHRFSAEFRDWYFLPMLGCIWSCPTDQMLQFPVATMVRFCHNHGLIQVTNRPQWFTVAGGARRYVDRIVGGLSDARLATPVRQVLRDASGGAGGHGARGRALRFGGAGLSLGPGAGAAGRGRERRGARGAGRDPLPAQPRGAAHGRLGDAAEPARLGALELRALAAGGPGVGAGLPALLAQPAAAAADRGAGDRLAQSATGHRGAAHRRRVRLCAPGVRPGGDPRARPRGGAAGAAPHLLCRRLDGLRFPRGRAEGGSAGGAGRAGEPRGGGGWRHERRRHAHRSGHDVGGARDDRLRPGAPHAPPPAAQRLRLPDLLPDAADAQPARAGAGHAGAQPPRAALSFHDADHGEGGADALAWMEALLSAQGITDADGEIWLHTYPRVLGFAFKPVSFWYCHRADGALRAVVAEVNNTFGERHCYLLEHPRFGQSCRAEKVFHVSPFCPVRGEYRFVFMRAPHEGRERTVARIDYHDEAGGPVLIATSISGTLEALTPQSQRRALWSHPLLTLGVIARIHWQAMRLWLRRTPFFRQPRPARRLRDGRHPQP